jgi:hypothetical protein
MSDHADTIRPFLPRAPVKPCLMCEHNYCQCRVDSEVTNAALDALAARCDILERELVEWRTSIATEALAARCDILQQFYDERVDLWHCTLEDKAAMDEANEKLWRRCDALENALRENVGDAYNLLTQGESPTQRRQPSAQRIYDRSRAVLAAAGTTRLAATLAQADRDFAEGRATTLSDYLAEAAPPAGERQET